MYPRSFFREVAKIKQQKRKNFVKSAKRFIYIRAILVPIAKNEHRIAQLGQMDPTWSTKGKKSDISHLWLTNLTKLKKSAKLTNPKKNL